MSYISKVHGNMNENCDCADEHYFKSKFSEMAAQHARSEEEKSETERDHRKHSRSRAQNKRARQNSHQCRPRPNYPQEPPSTSGRPSGDKINNPDVLKDPANDVVAVDITVEEYADPFGQDSVPPSTGGSEETPEPSQTGGGGLSPTSAPEDVTASDDNQAALEARFIALYERLMEKQVSFKEAIEPFKTDNQNAGKG